MVKRTAKDTEVTTRMIKVNAAPKPWRVIINSNPRIFQVANAWPGLNLLNKDGMAINNAKSGMNTQVRFRKNPTAIIEYIIVARKVGGDAAVIMV